MPSTEWLYVPGGGLRGHFSCTSSSSLADADLDAEEDIGEVGSIICVTFCLKTPMASHVSQSSSFFMIGLQSVCVCVCVVDEVCVYHHVRVRTGVKLCEDSRLSQGLLYQNQRNSDIFMLMFTMGMYHHTQDEIYLCEQLLMMGGAKRKKNKILLVVKKRQSGSCTRAPQHHLLCLDRMA